MKFPPEFLDEIRARLPVSDVVRGRVKLRKQGREWAGLSPFNAEKTPSFFVNDQKGFYHDFSSGKHGDIFDFMMETEGLSFPDTVERLAGMAGVPMPQRSPREFEQEKKRAGLLDVLAMAARFFEANLQRPVGAKARGYLSDRGLGAPVQKRFALGYAPGEKFALRDALAAQGVDVDQMIEAGLLVHGDDIVVPYDRFRDRVMFPIHDRSGKVIAFGGRAMEPGAKAKYLNSPETPLFHKGALLFNHHRARKPAHETGRIVVVEGYVDAIAMSEAGFPGVVAPLGTALTADQCALLWAHGGGADPLLRRRQRRPQGRVPRDRDGSAAYRARAKACASRFCRKVRTRTISSAPRVRPSSRRRSRARSLSRICFSSARPMGRASTRPSSAADLERRLSAAVAIIADETLRRHYQADMRRRLGALFGEDRAAGARAFRAPSRGGPRRPFPPQGPRLGLAETPLAPQERLARRTQEPAREILILAMLLNHPALLEAHWEEMAALEFDGRRLGAFRDACHGRARRGARVEPRRSGEALAAAGHGAETDRIFAIAATNAHLVVRASPRPRPSDAEHVLRQSMALHRRTGALHRELKLAERSLAAEPNEQNFARLLDIKTHLADLAHAEAAIDGFGELSGRTSSAI